MNQVQGMMGEEGAVAIEGLMESASEPRTSLIATVSSTFLLIFGATTVFAEIQNSLDRIWEVPEQRKPSGIWGFLRTRLLSFGLVLGIGFLLPEPYGLAADTVVNQPLAEAEAAEARRQAEIERLLDLVAADATDTGALSDLADAYLAGPGPEDLQRAAFVLLALIGQAPEDPEPYGRLITAYIRAEAWTDAAAATDALAELEPDSADVPFFRGLIAWQGEGDADTALAAFDEFLAMAPDDPRVPMIRALRAEAAAAGDE